jgi:cyanophycinase-like exopeptidase
MRWFLEQANGGDILVLRASGSDGYNTYLFSDLGVTVNSVETIVFNNAQASSDTYVLDKIQKAEAIWFAGGNQWNYISYWRNSAVSTLINSGISNRKIVVGGISAGMAILGGNYFTAENGTISSQAALMNPLSPLVTVSNQAFLEVPFLNNVVTDTHYDNPNRKGRHVVFMANALSNSNEIHGIACDEYVAVCIRRVSTI